MSRRGAFSIFRLLLYAGLAAGAYYAWVVVPPHWVHIKMDEIVQVSLLEWRDKSLRKARERLAREVEKRNIPDYIIPDEDCEFSERVGGERHLDCYWEVEVTFPFINKTQTFYFTSHKYLDSDDQLHDAGPE